MKDKPRFARAYAWAVASVLLEKLKPWCERSEIVGSLRRHRPYVGDVEILYVPRFVSLQDPFAGTLWDRGCTVKRNEVDDGLQAMIAAGVLAPRKNAKGFCCWGEKNKLALHRPSGVPVDLFATTQENWFVSLVIRTGGKETNIALCSAALRKGLQLHAYGDGFTVRRTGMRLHCSSEQDVFKFAGLRYREPKDRQ